MRWRWFTEEENNRGLNLIFSIASIIGVIFIGIWQIQINTELKNLTKKELVSSKTPLLRVDFSSLKFDGDFFVKEIEFKNEGLVPINVISYQVLFQQNPQKVESPLQVLDGTIFPGESITRKTIINRFPLNEVQLITINIKYGSLFDSKTMFCISRTFTFQYKTELMSPLNLTRFYECNDFSN